VKHSNKIAAAVLGLGVAAAAFAHPNATGGMGAGMMMHGMGMGPGAVHGGPMAAQQLMTPEERSALQEKMRNAKTPEERQKLAAETRAEMQKRAKEKGLALPAPHGAHP
jgi:hypothetical protein